MCPFRSKPNAPDSLYREIHLRDVALTLDCSAPGSQPHFDRHQCGPSIRGYGPGVRRKIMFKANVGGLDRFIRILLGLALISLIFVGPKTAWGLVGLVPLLTGLLRSCPLYRLLGINTCWRGPYG
jgi:hypothetical protein